MKKTTQEKYHIQSVSLAFSLLEQFRDAAAAELGVSELSRLMRIHKNHVFRLLATLESRQYIEQNPTTGTYRLGLKNLEVSRACIRGKCLVQQARPSLENLARQSREMVCLAVLRTGEVVYEDVVQSDQAVRVVARSGTRLPAHCTAMGKVLLADRIDSEMHDDTAYRSLTRDGGRTIISLKAFRNELQTIRDNGYGIDDEEYEVGTRGLAAPVRNHTSRVIGAVGIVGPAVRLSNERLHGDFAPLVARTAQEISLRMGYLPPRRARSGDKHPAERHQLGALSGHGMLIDR